MCLYLSTLCQTMGLTGIDAALCTMDWIPAIVSVLVVEH